MRSAFSMRISFSTWRMWIWPSGEGWRVGSASTSRRQRSIHHHGGTAGFGSDLSVYYGNRNIIWYAIKDFPTRLLITSLPFILARNLAVIPYYALRGQGRVILKSKMDALKGVTKMLRKRRDVVRRANDAEIERFVKTWSSMKRQ